MLNKRPKSLQTFGRLSQNNSFLNSCGETHKMRKILEIAETEYPGCRPFKILGFYFNKF